MPSYQDIETRLRVVEDKIDFVMRVFTLQAEVKSPLVDVPPKIIVQSLLQAYYAAKTAGRGPELAPDPAQE